MVISDLIDLSGMEDEIILHKINLFLELFGSCEIRDDNLDQIFKSKIKRLNWKVLPKGKMPWSKLEPLISEVTSNLKKGNKVVIDKRLETINQYSPEFVAIGKGGFSGYLIFGFPEKGIFILESTQINNATYIIEKNWELISTLTKAEILNNELHKKRVIHREKWFDEIQGILTS